MSTKRKPVIKFPVETVQLYGLGGTKARPLHIVGVPEGQQETIAVLRAIMPVHGLGPLSGGLLLLKEKDGVDLYAYRWKGKDYTLSIHGNMMNPWWDGFAPEDVTEMYDGSDVADLLGPANARRAG